MVSGSNTNVLYRGVLFHVQTEVSGREGIRVVTQLFHGGNVLASEKRDCGDLSGSKQRARRLRERMEGQHRAVVEGLKQGGYDDDIRARLGSSILGDIEDTADTADAPPPQPFETAEDTTLDELADTDAPRTFGDGVVSEKPLDELVLDYLVENARRRRKRGSS